MMEPIRLWRNSIDGITLDWGEDRAGMHEVEEEGVTEGVWLPRADYDAMVKDAAEDRRIASHYRDVCAVTGHDDILDRAADAVQDVWAAVRRHERREDVYPEDTIDRLAYERDAALKQRDEARGLLREARDVVGPFLRLLGKAYEIVMPSVRGLFALSKRRQRVEAALARIDRCLEDKA